jgi:hypothetical protein
MADLICLSTGFWLEEEGYGDRLFHTKAIIRDRACALTIDYKNPINAASLEMVEKLDLTTTLHPHPYLLHWGPNNLTITCQTKVHFSLGQLVLEVLCDVIPVHIVSCHLLLGRPWCTAQGAVYHMDDAYDFFKYSIRYGNTEYNLLSMTKALFKSWRDDRLKKQSEKAELKKVTDAAETLSAAIPSTENEANEAANYVEVAPSSIARVEASVTSFPFIGLTTDSKPRTVSPEEGEDDVAPPMLDSAYYTIPGYVVADTIKTKFLFLFLPRKEKIKEAIGVQYWWSVLSLKESGWGPPSSVLKMVAHQQKSPFYFSSIYFSFWFREQLSELLILFYIYIFVLLVSQVIGRSAATIKPKGCAPM